MHITHSYVGTSQGKYRCMFFMLLEDYIEAQSSFVKELDLELERFARNLGETGAVVRPFSGDIETTKTHIMEKNWPQEEIEGLHNTPGLLMLNVDFDEFDPRKHPWIYFHLGEKLFGDEDKTKIDTEKENAKSLFSAITKIVENPESDIFSEIEEHIDKISPSEFLSIIEAKPGAFGFSIDLVKGAKLLRDAVKG